MTFAFNSARESAMKVYSDAELHSILGVVNDPQFNTLCLRITTEPQPPLGMPVAEQPAEKPKGTADAELGGFNQ
jgi:hypothetical protein